jgi:hypothetical protein
MPDQPSLPNLTCPDIRFQNYPQPEQASAWRVNVLLVYLRQYLEDFEAALTLFEYCHEQMTDASRRREFSEARRYSDWMWIPLRDAAITIYHIGCAIEEIRHRHLGDCPTLRRKLDHDAHRIAPRLLAARFPYWRLMRHTVAHSAEIVSFTPEPKAGQILTSIRSLDHRRFGLYHFDRRTHVTTEVGYEMSPASLEFLRRVVSVFYSSFRPADDRTITSVPSAEGRQSPGAQPTTG